MPYFTKIKKGKDNKFRWNLKSDNHETIVASEPYDTKTSAYQGQLDLLKNVSKLYTDLIDESKVNDVKKLTKES